MSGHFLDRDHHRQEYIRCRFLQCDGLERSRRKDWQRCGDAFRKTSCLETFDSKAGLCSERCSHLEQRCGSSTATLQLPLMETFLCRLLLQAEGRLRSLLC